MQKTDERISLEEKLRYREDTLRGKEIELDTIEKQLLVEMEDELAQEP